MRESALEARLKEIEMTAQDAAIYQEFVASVQKEIREIRVLLESMEAKHNERTWLKNQGSGDLDDAKLIEGAPLPAPALDVRWLAPRRLLLTSALRPLRRVSAARRDHGRALHLQAARRAAARARRVPRAAQAAALCVRPLREHDPLQRPRRPAGPVDGGGHDDHGELQEL